MAQEVIIDITARFIDNTSQGTDKAKKKVDKLGESIERTRKQTEKFGKTKANVILSIKDKATQIITKTAKSLKSITGKVWNVTVKAIDKVTAPIRGIFDFLKKPLVIGASILGLSMGVTNVIDTYKTFESTMSKVGAISQASAEDMQALIEKAKQMGATTKFTASEAGEAFTYMAMAGWKTKEMLGSIEGVMNLAAASGEELGTVSDIVTDAMTAFGLAADGTTKIIGPNGLTKEVANATHFADVLAAASSNSNTNVALLGESFKYCAPLAGQYKFSIEDTALALGLMANSGIKASNSGTAMRRILTQLSGDFEVLQADGSKFVVATSNADGSMRSLKEILDDTRTAFNGMSDAEKKALGNDLTSTAKGLGIALEDENGKLKTQAELYSDVIEASQSMTDAGKVAEAEAIAGKTAMAGLLSIVGASDKDYEKLSKAVYNADGMSAKMAAQMMDNLEGDMVLFQSAAEGAKIAFMTKLSPALRSFVQWVTSKMPDVSKAMEKAADYISDKIVSIKRIVEEFMSSEEWQKADFFGKIGIAWDKVIAEPFGEWWGSTGKEFFAEKAKHLGKSIGTGVTAGLLAILGLDPKGAVEDGISIGASFAEGFSQGFDGKKVGEGLLNAIRSVFKDAGTLLPGGKEASSTSGFSAMLLAFAGSKLLKAGSSIAKGIGGLFGRNAGMAYGVTGTMGQMLNTKTMVVKASVVYVSGPVTSGLSPGSVAGATSVILPEIGGALATTALATTAMPLISTSLGNGTLALPGTAGSVAATAGSLTSATGWLGKLLQIGSSSSIIGADGTLISVTGGIGGSLGSVATTLGSGATTAAGAAVGGSTILGGIGAILGIGSGIKNIFEGTKLSGKEAKDKYVQGGTKIGMVGSGAAIGAGIGTLFGGIGAIPGAFIGAGIGGIISLFSGNKIGKWISDLTDADGAIGKFVSVIKEEIGGAWEFIKKGASDAGEWVSGKWNKVKESIGSTWNSFSKWFDNTVWMPIKDLGITAINIWAGAWESGRELLEGIWSSISSWFSENVWEPVKQGVSDATQWVGDKWDKVSQFINEKWNDFSSWFDETVWEPIKSGVGVAAQWIEGTLNSAKDIISNAWQSISGWFSEVVWEPLKRGVSTVGDWIGVKYEEAKTIVITAWKGVSSWFNETVWEPIKTKISEVKEWIKNSFSEAKEAIKIIWGDIKDWFSENVFNPIKETVSGIYNGIGEKLASLGEKGSEKTGLKTSFGEATTFTPHASGGIFTKPHIGLIGEAGTEYLIPTTGTNKYNGINLWYKAGKALGLIKEHAKGGIFGSSLKKESYISQTDSNTIINAPLTINMGGITFTFNGTGGNDKEGVMQIIRQQMPEIADEAANAIAEALQRIFPNLKAGYIQ